MSGVLANGRIRIAVAGLTDVGRQRKHNEDTVLVKAQLGLFAVADGMGGHNAGDVASKLVASSLGNFFEATEEGAPIGELPEDYHALHQDAQRLAAGVRKANHDVFTISNTNHAHHGMGSTVVAMHLANEVAYIAHVGDSRCYRIRDGEIVQLTRDHSLINDAIDMKPDLTKEELARLPRNIITRALGMKDGVKVDIRTEKTQPGDIFLLCSDGLTGMVPPEQILEVVGLTSEPQEACELLIAEANDAGGTDNISALIVRLDVAPEEEEEELDPELLADAETAGDAELEVVAEAVSQRELEAVAQAELETVDRVEVEAPRPLPAPIEKEEPEDPNGEPGLDLRGAWSADAAPVAAARCKKCSFELFPGNFFCVECGTRLDDPIP